MIFDNGNTLKISLSIKRCRIYNKWQLKNSENIAKCQIKSDLQEAFKDNKSLGR